MQQNRKLSIKATSFCLQNFSRFEWTRLQRPIMTFVRHLHAVAFSDCQLIYHVQFSFIAVNCDYTSIGKFNWRVCVLYAQA